MRIITTTALAMLLALAPTAQSRAASQSNIGPYFESFSDPKYCSNNNECKLSFLPLPAGKTYLIERVRCSTESTVVPNFLIFGPGAQPEPSNLLKDVPFALISTVFNTPSYRLVYEAIPMMLVGAGRYPSVRLQLPTSSTIGIKCSLSGRTI